MKEQYIQTPSSLKDSAVTVVFQIISDHEITFYTTKYRDTIVNEYLLCALATVWNLARKRDKGYN